MLSQTVTGSRIESAADADRHRHAPAYLAHTRDRGFCRKRNRHIPNARGEGPSVRFQNYRPRRFNQRPEPGSRWTMRSTRSLKTVAARGVGCALAERPYSSCREVKRTPGGFFRTTRGTLGSVLSPIPDGHPSSHSACANRCNCSQHLKSGFPQRGIP